MAKDTIPAKKSKKSEDHPATEPKVKAKKSAEEDDHPATEPKVKAKKSAEDNSEPATIVGKSQPKSKTKAGAGREMLSPVLVNDIRRQIDVFTMLEVELGKLYKTKCNTWTERTEVETAFNQLIEQRRYVLSSDQSISEQEREAGVNDLNQEIAAVKSRLKSLKKVDRKLKKLEEKMQTLQDLICLKMEPVVKKFGNRTKQNCPVLVRFFTDVVVIQKLSEWMNCEAIGIIAGSVTTNEADPINRTAAHLGLQVEPMKT